jgi:exodeoxyribonuclease VII small subunit
MEESEPPKEQPTFEQSLADLEAVVHDLEEGQLGLADSLARYEQGIGHLKYCYQLLDQAERKIDLLTGVASDGTPQTRPFEATTTPANESTGRRRKSSRSGDAVTSERAIDREIDASP